MPLQNRWMIVLEQFSGALVGVGGDDVGPGRQEGRVDLADGIGIRVSHPAGPEWIVRP